MGFVAIPIKIRVYFSGDSDDDSFSKWCPVQTAKNIGYQFHKVR